VTGLARLGFFEGKIFVLIHDFSQLLFLG